MRRSIPTRGGRRPARRRRADKLAGEFDLAGGNRLATLRISRPALRDSEPEITGHPPAQGMTIEWTRGECSERVPAQPRQQPGESEIERRPAISEPPLPLPLAAAVICPGPAVWRGPAEPEAGRERPAGGGNPMRLRNKEPSRRKPPRTDGAYLLSFTKRAL